MQPETNNPAAKVVPDAGSKLSKKEQVADMFNNIAGKYDFLNRFLSLGIDSYWSNRAISAIGKIQPKTILDVATGTGALAIKAAKLNPEKITGVDIARQMLEIGREKVQAAGLDHIIELQQGDSERLQFDDNSFDAITCAYGVRNFEHLEAGLKEMSRVLRPGGTVAILEFSHPKTFPFKQGYYLYFKYILPFVGRVFSKHKTAYTYLPQSVMAFPEGERFCSIMEQCGFTNAKAKPMTFGITTLYTASK